MNLQIVLKGASDINMGWLEFLLDVAINVIYYTLCTCMWKVYVIVYELRQLSMFLLY